LPTPAIRPSSARFCCRTSAILRSVLSVNTT
jgi:hypothetical protein